ncbi:MAG: porin [Bacteriovoracaceae bacterium]|nr:OprO/OprP family phosphate-selective porin [Bacteroidota bacterium]
MTLFIRFGIFATLLTLPLMSQEESADTAAVSVNEQIEQLKLNDESVNEILLDMKSYIDLARKLKFSGYMQTQFQASDGIGGAPYPIGNFAGGNFPANVGSRFQVRRGRLKVQYENDLTFSQYVVQFDITQNGLGIKDAYINIKDPWVRAWNMRMGVFDRPFGFEVAYSSNFRETPERSRMSQTLFPGERELGAMIEFAPEVGDWTNYNLKLGVFNGVLPTANENDNSKDIIGRVGFILPFEEENIAFDGGVSIYQGSVRSNSKFIYSFNDAQSQFTVDSTVTNAGKQYDRQYIGIDAQLIYDMPSLGGASLRCEYNFGTQPGTSSSNSFYNPSTIQTLDIAGNKTKSTIETTNLYQRHFYGLYISMLQNIGTKHQVVLRYDVLDPNSEIDGSEIGAAGKLTTLGDLKFSTIGAGYIYHLDDNVKFVFYYEKVENETVNGTVAATSSLSQYTKDVNDNVFTFRMQYRFPW